MTQKLTDSQAETRRRLCKADYHCGMAAINGKRDLTNPFDQNGHMWWGWQKAIKEGKQ